MQVEGSFVHYLLVQEFDDVECDRSARSVEVDYPILYDETADMRGHAALVPSHERPHAGVKLEGSLCVCMGADAADAARAAGFSVIQVRDEVTFPRLYNYMQSVFVRFERLDVLLRAYIDARTGAQALLDACSKATGCPFALVDDEYRIICQSVPVSTSDAGRQARPFEFDMLESDVVDLFMASRDYRHMRTSHNVFAIPGSSELLMKNVFAKGELKGMLASRHDGTALSARYTRFVLRYLGGYVEKAYGHLGSFGVGPTELDRIRAALAGLLTKSATGAASVQSLITEDGRITSQAFVVLRIDRSFTNEGRDELEYLARRFELACPRAYCFIADKALYMLADAEHPTSATSSSFSRDILIAARDNLAKAGMSRPFTSLHDIGRACWQATAALEQGTADDPEYWYYRFQDYALAYILDNGVKRARFEDVAHPAIEALSRHDARNGTSLLETLSTFMRCRYNATHAAQCLFVARSTLLNRLDRIAELTGIDFDDADDLLYLSVSLRLIPNPVPEIAPHRV